MTECLNETMRDRLPELANGTLPASEASVVRAHAAVCVACAAELAVLETSRLVLMASAPKVDAAAIARAVTASVPALRVERGGAHARAVARRPFWRSRQVLAAAASILVVVSLTIPVLDGPRGTPQPSPATDSAVAAPVDSPAAAPAPTSLAVGDGLTDLSADDLSTLLAELDRVEANITAEPATLRQPLVDTPEGL